MKSKSLYIASRERHAGSLAISFGLMTLLHQKFEKVAFFRPVVEETQDADCLFMQSVFDLPQSMDEMVGFTLDKVIRLLSEGHKHELYEKLIAQYQKLLQQYDFVLVQGMELSRMASTIDFDLNLNLSKHFNAPFVPVLNGKDKTLQEVESDIEMEIHAAHDEGITPFAVFANQVKHSEDAEAKKIFSCDSPQRLTRNGEDSLIFYLPYLPDLDTPTVKETYEALNGRLLLNDKVPLTRLVKRPVVAAMTAENYLSRVQEGDLIIVPGDRTDILTVSVMSLYSRSLPNISGIMLTGGLIPSPIIMALLSGYRGLEIPLISVATDTYPTAMKAHEVRARLYADNEQKNHLVLSLFDQYVHKDCLLEKFVQPTADVTTPMMFEYRLFEKAKQSLQTIVLPEANDERILKACEILLQRKVVRPVLLGKPEEIHYHCNLLGINLDGVEIIDHEESEWKSEFIQTLYELRKHKGMTLDLARDSISHVSYFATMMVHLGYADGMVSGATHTTADTVRPALQIIKTKPGTALVSSVFFMCFDTRVLVYGDCAVNQHPDADQLAEIAISSADTAARFDIQPKVALLSYSTGDSGQGDEVDKVRQAAKMAKQRRPDLTLEGPLQYDAAIDPEVARQKMPDSDVAGQATVFIFPDLNTGNNTYKAVQRASGAIAIGPVLQGLNKPVNDLSRGCTVDDVVNTVAITAIQAQQMHAQQEMPHEDTGA
ncbi:phosphate acetyltransferase [Hydrogenovibrio sp. JE_KL2]|uniref:phosphate acetyltransferase n=1 Tax=Hydrogenovibrio sp. JE_KL2 TaxID=2651188 RepID=UPI00128AE558|nr:phosphate acetyltransferase [Hydrogenovibrio sp. JE_KL2]MPQ77133.1 phosphate acetyltransferase [Hydrogenovibrio sp. JE_KL2]